MFFHRFADTPRGGPPPFMGGAFARRHGRDRDEGDWGWPPFGPGGPFGRGRRFGRGPDRLFERGDLKYVILDLLRERPRHGYDIIRALEERFGGLYSPSPGSVYPTLQLLEDQGLVSSSQQDGKKVSALTEAGRAFLAQRAETVAGIKERVRGRRGGEDRAELHALMGELRELAGTVFRQGARGAFHDPARLRQLREVVARARREIDAILAGEPAPSADL
jgi:DNA-binding PadR family transcriptional regulator